MFKKIPHTYVIIFSFIIAAAILTWVIPGGVFQREIQIVNNQEREIIVKDSFSKTANNPQTWEILSALYDGFIAKADIIVFILIIGGAFWILNESRSVDVGIQAFLKFSMRLNKFKLIEKIGINNIIITLIMLLFSLFGATFGMSEETIAFIIIFVPLSIKMGYDSIVGVSMCFVGAGLGFAGALFNPFTIGIAQGLSNLPLFSGLEYRLFCWFVINAVGIGFVLTYAKKIYKKPESSPLFNDDKYWRDKNAKSNLLQINYFKNKSAWYIYAFISLCLLFISIKNPTTVLKIGNGSFEFFFVPFISLIFVISGLVALFKSVHFFNLILLMQTILILIIGVMGYGWYIKEIATLFFGLGLFSGIASGYNANKITKLFLEGVRDILSAALVVGLAGGIIIILKNGQIMDTLLYSASKLMENFGKYGSLVSIYFTQTLINIVIPSGSAQAALTIPIMSQFSDLMGLSRQAIVMAFQFGDGFTNMITPTSPVLIGVLGVAKIPYEKWLKWVGKFILILTVLGMLLLIPTVFMKLNGF